MVLAEIHALSGYPLTVRLLFSHGYLTLLHFYDFLVPSFGHIVSPHSSCVITLHFLSHMQGLIFSLGVEVKVHVYAFLILSGVVILLGDFECDGTGHVWQAILDDAQHRRFGGSIWKDLLDLSDAFFKAHFIIPKHFLPLLSEKLCISALKGLTPFFGLVCSR